MSLNIHISVWVALECSLPIPCIGKATCKGERIFGIDQHCFVYTPRVTPLRHSFQTRPVSHRLSDCARGIKNLPHFFQRGDNSSSLQIALRSRIILWWGMRWDVFSMHDIPTDYLRNFRYTRNVFSASCWRHSLQWCQIASFHILVNFYAF